MKFFKYLIASGLGLFFSDTAEAVEKKFFVKDYGRYSEADERTYTALVSTQNSDNINDVAKAVSVVTGTEKKPCQGIIDISGTAQALLEVRLYKGSIDPNALMNDDTRKNYKNDLLTSFSTIDSAKVNAQAHFGIDVLGNPLNYTLKSVDVKGNQITQNAFLFSTSWIPNIPQVYLSINIRGLDDFGNYRLVAQSDFTDTEKPNRKSYASLTNENPLELIGFCTRKANPGTFLDLALKDWNTLKTTNFPSLVVTVFAKNLTTPNEGQSMTTQYSPLLQTMSDFPLTGAGFDTVIKEIIDSGTFAGDKNAIKLKIDLGDQDLTVTSSHEDNPYTITQTP